jgi:hypothetical protein
MPAPRSGKRMMAQRYDSAATEEAKIGGIRVGRRITLLYAGRQEVMERNP